MQPQGFQGYPPLPWQIQRSSYSVAFDERFSVPLDPAALEENSLRFSVFGIDEDERSVSTGVAELKLSDLDLATRPFNAWLYLQDTNKVRQEGPSSQLGQRDVFASSEFWRCGMLEEYLGSLALEVLRKMGRRKETAVKDTEKKKNFEGSSSRGGFVAKQEVPL